MRKLKETINKEASEFWKLTPLIIASIIGWEIGKLLF